MEIISRKIVFSTPWFDLIAKNTGAASERDDRPHYCLTLPDYVSVIAVTSDSKAVLVRQYRPAVERFTLELPSGHVDAGEAAEQSAARELYEETGYRAPDMALLGISRPDTGRMANRVWYFLALDAVRDAGWQGPEQGVEPVLKPLEEWIEDMRQGLFDHSLHLAPILLALLRSGRFSNLMRLNGAFNL